jgi:uncharacterized membrane protein
METVKEYFGVAGYVVEGIGVAILLVGCVLAAAWYVARFARMGAVAAYQEFRRDLARSIILGLEFLIAGDIIRTVTVNQTLESVGVLVVIVLIRTFLTFTLQLEIEGRWPWQRPEKPG